MHFIGVLKLLHELRSLNNKHLQLFNLTKSNIQRLECFTLLDLIIQGYNYIAQILVAQSSFQKVHIRRKLNIFHQLSLRVLHCVIQIMRMLIYQEYFFAELALVYPDRCKLNRRFKLLFRLVRKYPLDCLVDLRADVHF